MKNRTEPPNRYTNEHPDDKRSRLESSAIAVREVDAFAEAHREELLALLWTYGDSIAENKFMALREAFWSSLPFPTGGEGEGESDAK